MPWTQVAYVDHNQTFDAFAARFAPPLRPRDLFQNNARCEALSGVPAFRMDVNVRNTWFAHWWVGNPGAPIRLLVPDNAVDQHPVAAPPALETLPFRNAGYDWLTYETVLNKPKFRKTNQPRPVGMYFVQLSDMQIWIRDDMPAGALDALCEGFFPDHAPDRIQLLSDASWWWKQPAELTSLGQMRASYWQADVPVAPLADFPAVPPRSAPAIAGARSVVRLHLPEWALMPYNYLDNDSGSRALGTAPNDVTKVLQFDLQGAHPWQFWRTASRSSVMRLTRLKAKGAPWRKQAWSPWRFDTGEADRVKFMYDQARLPQYANHWYQQDVAQAGQLRVANLDASYFSVKTGVCYVGFERQTGSGKKDVVGADGEWLVGAMHSDYIKAIDKLVVPAHGPAQRIVLQTELMAMVERRIRDHDDGQQVSAVPGSDGVSIRDLSVLRQDHYYIPPLSIPFIGADLGTLTEEFENVADAAWCDFWQRNWAEALGSAKAWFMLRYGMQHANPNVQNYLLEFATGGVAPGGDATVVIRDVADALLHREVAWALFGNPAEVPPAGADDDAFAKLATMRLPVLRFNFRTAAFGKETETGTTNIQFGVPGTQLLWARFSTFYANNKPRVLAECPATRVAAVLVLMAQWGRAHNANYVRTVERALGRGFEDMPWHDLPNPGKYLLAPNDDTLWTADNDKEVEIQSILHAYLASMDGQNAIRAYHNRGWADAAPIFTARLRDAADQPVRFVPVFLHGAGTTSRMTDRDGLIPFYGGVPADYDFAVTGKVLVRSEAHGVVTLTQAP